jgi:hypothetical protein
MSYVMGNTACATYSWHEAIERIAACDDLDELDVLCNVLNDEKKKYALFFLKLIGEAAILKRQMLLRNEH